MTLQPNDLDLEHIAEDVRGRPVTYLEVLEAMPMWLAVVDRDRLKILWRSRRFCRGFGGGAECHAPPMADLDHLLRFDTSARDSWVGAEVLLPSAGVRQVQVMLTEAYLAQTPALVVTVDPGRP